MPAAHSPAIVFCACGVVLLLLQMIIVLHS
jgi:hypothetical protein